MQKVLDELIHNSPIPVVRGCTKKFILDNLHHFEEYSREPLKDIANQCVGGASLVCLSDEESKLIGQPKEFFLLEDENFGTPAIHVYYMFHELGHYVCRNTKCKCSNNKFDLKSRTREEYHADIYAMKNIMRHGYLEALSEMYFHTMSFYWHTDRTNPYHRVACRLIKTKLWEKATLLLAKRDDVELQAA